MNQPRAPKFKFVDQYPTYDSSKVFLVRIDPRICQTDELLKAIYYSLWLPGHFGFNWDALYDCLCDLAWLPCRKVVLVHDCVPKISEEQILIYLEVLRDSIESLENNGERILEVIFAKADEAQVARILTSKAPEKAPDIHL